MKKVIYIGLGLLLFSASNVSAQFWKKVKDDVQKEADKIAVPTELPSSGALSEDEVGRGVKEALNQGVKKGVAQLNKKDGYFKDPQIKIPMPEEAKKVESKLRSLGQGKKVDEAIESMNRAAEDAAAGAKDIFVAAQNNDKLALETIKYTGEILGKSLTDYVALFSPEAIFLTGGLAKAHSLLIPATENAMNKNMLKIFKETAKILLSSLLEQNAGLLGAAAMAISN